MISRRNKRKIESAVELLAKRQRKEQEARDKLRQALSTAKGEDSATFRELGELINVSRQRVHQMLNEDV